MTLVTCRAPEPCPTPDLCGDRAECCWLKGEPEGTRSVMVPVSSRMLAMLSEDWSGPVQVRIETDGDGGRALVFRTVDDDRAC